MLIALEDESYVNSDHVVRWHVTAKMEDYCVVASATGPQMPYIVSTHDSKELAQASLDRLAYNIALEAEAGTL